MRLGEGQPLLLVLAGHNGAGKSTCYRKFIGPAFNALIGDRHIDPDKIERELRAEWEGPPPRDLDGFSRMAQQEAADLRYTYLSSRQNFSFETVFSDPARDKVAFLGEARRRGYVVALMAVGLDSPAKSEARVHLRVSRSGHDVPRDRIYERYPRVLSNFEHGVKAATLALLVDNSTDAADPDGTAYKPFALFDDGVQIHLTNPPDWWSPPFPTLWRSDPGPT